MENNMLHHFTAANTSIFIDDDCIGSVHKIVIEKNGFDGQFLIKIIKFANKTDEWINKIFVDRQHIIRLVDKNVSQVTLLAHCAELKKFKMIANTDDELLKQIIIFTAEDFTLVKHGGYQEQRLENDKSLTEDDLSLRIENLIKEIMKN